MTSRATPTKKKPTQSGYAPCACRDCMEIAIQGPGEENAYCAACEAAVHPPQQSSGRMRRKNW